MLIITRVYGNKTTSVTERTEDGTTETTITHSQIMLFLSGADNKENGTSL